jgi:Iron hydrogenase small subunit
MVQHSCGFHCQVNTLQPASGFHWAYGWCTTAICFFARGSHSTRPCRGSANGRGNIWHSGGVFGRHELEASEVCKANTQRLGWGQAIRRIEEVYLGEMDEDGEGEEGEAARKLYRDWVRDVPGGILAQELLHTAYHKRDKTVLAAMNDW